MRQVQRNRPPPLYYKNMFNLFLLHKPALHILQNKFTKPIYLILMARHYRNYLVFPEHIWNTVFERELPWNKLWAHNFASYATGKTQDVLCKVMHNCLPTRARLKRNHRDDSTSYSEHCKYCKKRETTLHLMARCRIATRIWYTYRPI